MKREEVTQELSDPIAQELLRSGVLARLAYNTADGFPRVIPVGFHWNGEQIVVCTAPTSPKVRALASRPNIALTIDTDAAKALSVRGIATLEVVEGVPHEYIAASRKSMDEDQLRDFEAHVRTVHKQMARISIEPKWAKVYDFGAGRVPSFLQKLVNDSGL